MPLYDAILPAPMCSLGACFSGEALTRLDFIAADTPASTRLDTRSRQLERELDTYWHNPAHVFDLLFVPQGTPFQLRVWHALLKIPPGQPTTYGALAKQLGTAARAVGQACARRPARQMTVSWICASPPAIEFFSTFIPISPITMGG